MNIREYVENPMGKGDTSIPNKQLLLSSLDQKYVKLTNHKKIDMKVYKDVGPLKGDDYYFHLVIPSETDRDNTYDIVFFFNDPKKEHHHELSISNYDCKVFSNCPSFAYTFAYAYNEHGLVIESLRTKLGRDFFTKKPVVRNRYEIINFDKYLYIGARFILDSKRLNKAALDVSCLKYSANAFQKRIRTLVEIEEEYHSAEMKVRQQKKYKKTSEKRTLDKENRVAKRGSVGPVGTTKRPIKTLRKNTQSVTKPTRSVKSLKKK